MTSFDEPFSSDPYRGTRRNKLDMILDVLDACQSPLKLTRIMYKTNINCNVLKEIVDVLVAKRFVRTIPLKKRCVLYKITRRGSVFLGKFEELKQLWDSTEPSEPIQVPVEEEIIV